MVELKLIPLLRHILPPAVMKRLSFILSRKDCHDYKKYPPCHKMYDTLLRKTASRAVYLENQILFVDVRPVSMRHNPVGICYLPYPLLESSTIRMRGELFQMLQLILYCSFIPCIGLPLLTSICCTLLDLVNYFVDFTCSNCLRLTDVIIVHLTPQFVAYPGQEHFNALVEEVIDFVVMDCVDDAYGEEELEDL